MEMKRFILIISAAFLMLSCIKNDIPYPKVVPTIISVEVEGGTASIDAAKRLVTLNLE